VRVHEVLEVLIVAQASFADEVVELQESTGHHVSLE
jgi:hypothetical protein